MTRGESKAGRANAPAGASGAEGARAEHLAKMLDAAHEVVLREGMGRLTIEAVAKVAGLSKAGLLHHFPSKDALVLAMVTRHVDRWRSEFMALRERLRSEGHTSPTTRAMMGLCMSGQCVNDEDERTGNRVLIAALVHDEKHIEPLRKLHDEVVDLVNGDSLQPGAGELVHLAVHGLWLGMIFGFQTPNESRLSKVREVLQRLIEDDRGRGGTAKKPVEPVTYAARSVPGSGLAARGSRSAKKKVTGRAGKRGVK
ncbi:MAG: TetR/AcrR family transcriptional regulator [Phycisphaerales bacterium]|nr:TetR/AcrR family transcriptional regulator [Phycisphaerales bacterium]